MVDLLKLQLKKSRRVTAMEVPAPRWDGGPGRREARRPPGRPAGAPGAVGGRDAGRVRCHLGRAESAEQAGHPQPAGGRAAEGPDAADAPGRDKSCATLSASRRSTKPPPPRRRQVYFIYVSMFSPSNHWHVSLSVRSFCLVEVNTLPLMASISFYVYQFYVTFPLFLFCLSIALITTAAHHHPPLIF